MAYPSKLSRDAVVDAALALVEREGRPALGMRAVAGVLGVRPASLYKHVGDLAGLEALVAECAATALAAEIDAALARVASVPAGKGGDPAVGLRATADAYVRFAHGRPALYGLLADATVQARPGEARKALWNRLLAVVGALTGDADDTGGAVAVWAFLHGFVALGAAGLYGASGPHDGFARGVAALAAGLPDSLRRAR